jgi:succinyl-diaminopimelate desuccinylase
VVPDEASVLLNLRVAPDRTADEAIRWLRGYFAEFLEGGDQFVVEDAVDGAPPGLDQPIIARLVDLSQAEPRAKLGFTDVATFAAMGIPAANFGAGDPELAHHADERVSSEELGAFYDVMARLLAGTDS